MVLEYEKPDMEHGRALLTEREREAIRGDGSDSYRYKTRTYLRSRLDELAADADLLREREPELYQELLDAVGGDLDVQHDDGPDGGRRDTVETQDTVETRDTGGVSDVSVGERAVEDLELEGAGSRLEARKDALAAVVDYLEANGSADVSAVKEILDEYDHGYGDADGAWANLRRQNVFDELPVETPGRGGREYRYAGDE